MISFTTAFFYNSNRSLLQQKSLNQQRYIKRMHSILYMDHQRHSYYSCNDMHMSCLLVRENPDHSITNADIIYRKRDGVQSFMTSTTIMLRTFSLLQKLQSSMQIHASSSVLRVSRSQSIIEKEFQKRLSSIIGLQQRRGVSSSNNSTNSMNQNLIPFLLADIGEGIKEVEVIEWYVSINQRVQQFDILCKVQSDKATVDITSRYDGIIAALGGTTSNDNNDTDVCIIQVGQPLLYFYPDGENDLSTTANITSTTDTTPTPTLHQLDYKEAFVDTKVSQSIADEEGYDDDIEVDDKSSTIKNGSTIVQTSPAVRKIAKDYSIDLSTINGTGPNQRILKSDILSYLESNRNSNNMSSSNNSSAKTTDIIPTPSIQRENEITKDKLITLRGYQRSMIHSMTSSLSIPHMCLGDEIILNTLLNVREQINHSIKLTQSSGTTTNNLNNSTKISIMSLLIKAVSLSLKEYPIVNSVQTEQSLTDGTILQCNNHNFGIAMDTNRGLVVPLLYHCQNLTVLEIQHMIAIYKEKAKANSFTPNDFSSATSNESKEPYNASTFTISNIGSIGSGMFVHPIIVPPSLAMVAFGQTKVVPRFVSETKKEYHSMEAKVQYYPTMYDTDTTTMGVSRKRIYEAHVMNITWAGDHRFLDGATLGRLHNTFRYYIEENPMALLL